MRISNATVLSTTLLFTTACSTLNDSLKLGAGLGAATGLAATAAAAKSNDHNATSDHLTNGALIGLTAGLITAYFTHNQVVKERQSSLPDQPEIEFGDIPPSPFIFPKNPNKRGNQ